MKVPTLFSSAVLLGAVSISLAGAPRSFGQAVSKPRLTTTRPVNTVVPITSDTGSTTTAATDPVGFMKVGGYDASGNYTGVLANSDTYVSPPFTLPPAFTGLATSISGNVITVSGSPGFTSGQYAPSTTLPSGYTDAAPPRYYVLFAASSSSTNPKEGSFYSVTANDASTLTIDLNGDSLSTIPAGTQITVIPYWTFATLFPASDANVSYIPSTTTFNHQMEVLIPNLNGQGINLAPSATYYYISSGSNVGWRKVGRAATTDSSIDPLYPDAFFIMRNNTATATNFTVVGSVLTKKLSTPLATQTGSQQDNFVTLARPASQTLNQSGLFSSGAFSASTSSFNHVDELYVFNNNTAAINKSTSTTYYYINSGSNVGWRQVGGSATADVGDVAGVIQPGSAYIVRKGSSDGTSKIWTNAPNY